MVTAFDLALQSTPDARLSSRLEEMSLEEAERMLIRKPWRASKVTPIAPPKRSA